MVEWGGGVLQAMNNQIMYWNRKTQAEASDTQITPHFTMAEHQCKCGDCIVQRVHIDLYPMLEELRGALEQELSKFEITNRKEIFDDERGIRKPARS